MKTITILKNNTRTLVRIDDDDYAWAKNFTWHINPAGYVVRYTNKKQIRLHRAVMNAPDDLVVDHLDGDKLNCQKRNLRICTQSVNAKNLHGIKGYTFDKSRNKWLVRYHEKFYGRYSTEEEAAKAYRNAKSGVEYKKIKSRNSLIPKHIHRQKGKWGYDVVRNGIRYRKNGFNKISEAVQAMEKMVPLSNDSDAVVK